jgi:hypothetical protein
MDHHDERLELKSLTQLTARAAMIERGTAAQGVPVRQKRVAELDDDVAVLSSGQLEETKRDWRFRESLTRCRSENYAGGDSALCGNSKKFSREKNFPSLQRAKKHTFSRVTVAKPLMPKKSRKLESTSREPDFGSHNFRFFHGNESETISTLLNQCAKSLETRGAHDRGG